MVFQNFDLLEHEPFDHLSEADFAPVLVVLGK